MLWVCGPRTADCASPLHSSGSLACLPAHLPAHFALVALAPSLSASAVSSAPESPNVIAGRLSPARPEGGGGTQAQQQGQGQAQAGGQAQGQQRPGGPLSPAANFGALLAAAEERSGVKEAGSWLSGGSTADPVLEGSGSGIGRPSSRTWRPPPIPHPTITASGSKSGASTPATSIAHAAGGAAVANGHAVNGGDAIELGSSGRAASGASLGEDFSSA
jgi:hypothetical protein